MIKVVGENTGEKIPLSPPFSKWETSFSLSQRENERGFMGTMGAGLEMTDGWKKEMI